MISGTLRVLFYLALGPLAAMLAGNLVIGLSTLAFTGSAHDFAFGPGLLAPDNLIISYTLGWAPALLTGLVALLLARAFQGWRYWLWVGFGGASLSMALAWIVFGTAPLAAGINPYTFSLVIAAAGGAAGVVCAAAFDALAGLIRRRT